MRVRDVVILGSTGSIGTQALDVVTRNPGAFRVVAIAAGGTDVQALAAQAARSTSPSSPSPTRAVPLHCSRPWRRTVPPPPSSPVTDAASEAAAVPADVVLNGMTGSIGLRPTLAALDAGSVLALANKESLVAGGPLVKAAAKPGQIVPVDSEHSALAQCLRGGTADEVRRLVLTASGGPFRGRARSELGAVTPEQALAHPTWSMGPVVTTNSATMVNKALEVIEAHLLFDVPLERIDVVVHPQSMVHSMVEFFDGSTVAQVSPPDMRLPIALGLAWPDRVPHPGYGCDWTTASTWTFEPLDDEAFPAVALARHAATAGGTAPAVFNAANEELVTAFFEGRAPVPRHRRHPDRGGGRAPRAPPGEPPRRAGRPSGGGLGPSACPRADGTGDVILLEMLGWLIFLLGVGFSIGMHEIGHLLPAKAFGVKVTQYMVGFGPTAWAKHSGETEYGVKWIPLGGYIRMIGMYPPEKGADPTMLRASSTGRWSTLINDARQASLEEVEPEDSERVFYKLPVRKRIVVMLGGPVMNLVLALIMFTTVISVIGIQTDLDGNYNLTNRVGAVVQCVPTKDQPQGTAAANGECTGSTPTPAFAGGLQRGDTILSVAGTPTASWADVQAAIKDAPTGDVVVVVDREGQQIVLTVPLAAVDRPVLDADGKDTGQTEKRNFLGISPATERVTQPVTAVPGYMWDLSKRAMGTILTLPVRLWDLAVSTFTDAPRDQQGIVGPVGVGRITGEIVALDETPGDRQGRRRAQPAGRPQPVPVPVQPHPAPPARRRTRGRGRSGSRSSAAGRGSATSPTRARSTSPRPCRSRT